MTEKNNSQIEILYKEPSKEEIAEYMKNKEIEECKQCLKDTDWYITRELERGIKVPKEITEKRIECIKFIQDNESIDETHININQI